MHVHAVKTPEGIWTWKARERVAENIGALWLYNLHSQTQMKQALSLRDCRDLRMS